MQSKELSKRILIASAFAGCAFFVVFFFGSFSKSLIYDSIVAFIRDIVVFSEPKKVDSGLHVLAMGKPSRLRIPVINVDAVIEYVGFTSDGAMDVPKNQDDVAWFELGPRPGESGSAVIAGHYGWKDGKGSVFDNLYKLREGDKLYIEDDKGVTISFVVRKSRRYDPAADASDVFSSDDGKAHLNFITCEGVWEKTSESYPQRLVVFTDKEME